MITQAQKCKVFKLLHQEPGAFIMPNPVDLGGARLLQGMGFRALATTSAGFAYTLGRADGDITLEEKLAHCTLLCAGTSVPINADFEDGFADVPEQVAANIRRLAETGVAGCSIEDFNRDDKTLYGFNHALERIAAAAEVVASLPFPFQLTARAENLLRGVNDLDDTITRLQAYEKAGANVLYAPGIKSLADLETVTAAIGSPFNVLAPFIRGANLEQFAEAGAKRVSIGGALNLAEVLPVLQAGREMLEKGSFNWTGMLAERLEINNLFEVQDFHQQTVQPPVQGVGKHQDH